MRDSVAHLHHRPIPAEDSSDFAIHIGLNSLRPSRSRASNTFVAGGIAHSGAGDRFGRGIPVAGRVQLYLVGLAPHR